MHGTNMKIVLASQALPVNQYINLKNKVFYNLRKSYGIPYNKHNLHCIMSCNGGLMIVFFIPKHVVIPEKRICVSRN